MERKETYLLFQVVDFRKYTEKPDLTGRSERAESQGAEGRGLRAGVRVGKGEGRVWGGKDERRGGER